MEQQQYTMESAVLAAQQDKADAFAFLYENTWESKFRVARQYMKNDADAEDVLQEAYLRAWKSLKTLKDPGTFSSWLTTIVSRTALNTLKRKQPLLFSEMDAENEDGEAYTWEQEDFRTEYRPEQAYTEQERRTILHEMIDSLSDEQRMCVLMYYVDEQPVKDIAEAAGCPENTVKSRLNYGRKKLKAKAEELEKKGYHLYGLPVAGLLRYLLKDTELSTEEAGVIREAMRRSAEKVLRESGSAGMYAELVAEGVAAKSAGTAAVAASGLGIKVAAAVIGVALIGGIYGVSRFGGGAGTEQASTAELTAESEGDTTTGETSDAGVTNGPEEGGSGAGEADNRPEIPDSGFVDEETARAIQETLPTETRAQIERDLAGLEEGDGVQWLYFDDDPYPELLITDTSTVEEQGTPTYYMFYGATGEQIRMRMRGQEAPFQLLGYLNGGQYFVPGEGLILDEHFQDEGRTGDISEMVTMVFRMEEPGFIDYQYILSRSNWEVDTSVDPAVRKLLPEGIYRYQMTDENMQPSDITEEEYIRLHYYEDARHLSGTGWPNGFPD
ncbi:MAG: RNA polymerase sigma factor [Lachnospiraceae bacterium]|nr:RNA polymerase sigma factor [Lachnospiraceae bacterium]